MQTMDVLQNRANSPILNNRTQGGNQTMSRLIGGTLLVAGTCIGAGMLGLPVSTAAGGMYHTSVFFLVCWMMMTATAFLMLEASLWHKTETNLISMARHTLGKTGEAVAWLTYVLLLYSLMAAYTAGGTAIASHALSQFGIPTWLSSSMYVGLFAFVVYLGTQWVDAVNRIFMAGLIAAYFGLVFIGAPNVKGELLSGGHVKYLYAALPLMVTSFGFHLLIPSLKTYLNNDVKKLRLSIFLGSLIPLFVYLMWEMMILGIIPRHGEQGLIEMLKFGQPVVDMTQRLSEIVESNHIGWIMSGFTFCAIITSFIGVALGLFDFFADGLKIKKTHKGRALLSVITFLPPVMFVLFYPQGFILALKHAGIFAAILLVIYPALMVYVGRYKMNIKGEYRVMGGRFLPVLAMAFGFVVIVVQLLDHLGSLPNPLL